MADQQKSAQPKSSKKAVIIIAVIAIVIIVVISVLLIVGPSSEGAGENAAENSGASSATSEEQKYAEFEAELTCELLEAGSAGDIAAVLEKTASVMEKYGYDDAEYNRLKTKYENDAGFKALVLEEMEDRCPGLIE